MAGRVWGDRVGCWNLHLFRLRFAKVGGGLVARLFFWGVGKENERIGSGDPTVRHLCS